MELRLGHLQRLTGSNPTTTIQTFCKAPSKITCCDHHTADAASQVFIDFPEMIIIGNNVGVVIKAYPIARALQHDIRRQYHPADRTRPG